jgi:NitT/TauT family transport system substrate-binding protein
MYRLILLVTASLAAFLLPAGAAAADSTAGAGAGEPIKIALNWVPEPEFGGIYAAQQAGIFKANGLDVQILPGGAGAPTWQMVGAGKVPFAIASADEVAIARTRGADIIALFAIYQTCPQGIMVHEGRGHKSIADVFTDGGGMLAMEKGLTYSRFLEKEYGFAKVKLVSYSGGIAAFMADKNYAQQCFIFSEPIAAKRQGAKVKTFLVADAGYNPYAAVLIAKTDYVKANRTTAEAMIKSFREGWQKYLSDPKPANDLMHALNKTMDPQTFAEAADVQKPLILPQGMKSEQIGTMTLERWQTLIAQMRELKVLDRDVDAQACFLP